MRKREKIVILIVIIFVFSELMIRGLAMKAIMGMLLIGYLYKFIKRHK